MRVLLISFLGRSGMIHYSSQLANALTEYSDVSILVPEHAEVTYFNDKVKIHQIRSPPNILGLLLMTIYIPNLIKIYKIIHDIRPDIIHIVNTHPWNLFIFLFSSPLTKKIYTLHDPKPHELSLSKNILQPLLSFIDNTTIKYSNKIIVHGEILKKICVERGFPIEKIAVVPHGDFSFFTKFVYDNNNNDDINNDINKYVLFFGGIQPYKGLGYFIKAAGNFCENDHVKFIIAGEGDISPYKNLIVNNNMFNIINRYIRDDEVAKLFIMADIVVLPYISATQTGIIPIAYAFKKSIIATNVGAIPEIIDNGKTGILVEPKDVAAISNAIKLLLHDDELRFQLGTNGFNKMTKDLSWEAVSKRTNDIYANLIKT